MSLRGGRQADEAIPSLAGEEIASPGDASAPPLAMTPFNVLARQPSGRRSNPPLPDRRSLHLGVHQHLRSLPTPQELVRLPQASPPEIEEVFPHPVSGLPVQVSSSWRRMSMAFIVRWDYDQLLPDGQVDRTSVKLLHSLAPAQTYLAELTSTGFTRIETYGDFDESPYEPDSPELILVAFR